MIVLDVSVVVTALPSIHHALNFSSADLSWVQSAYALTFGGLLLLGARAGDILGRRRTFVVGIGVFTAASLLGGLAQSSTLVLTARAVQGVGGAIAAPSTLALLTVNFPEGPPRTKALAAYSAVAGGGGSVGLVLGGMLTAWISWGGGLFINVPIGIALMVLAPRVLAETERRTGHFDVAGAVTSTLASSTLVYGFVRAASDGWGDPGTLVSFSLAVVLGVAFVLRERHATHPITPLRLFADRERAGALVARMLVVGAMFSMFFFLSQYLQGVRGWSPLHTGLAFLPLTLVLFGMVQVVPRLSARIGDRRLLIAGVALAGTGMAWLSQLSETTPFFPAIAVPLVVIGLGMGSALAPLTAAGIVRVQAEDAGAASGLVNVAHQLGGSLGLSILVTVFTAGQHAAESNPVATGSAATQAQHVLASGVSAALTGSLVGLTVALAVVVFGMRRAPMREAVATAPVTRWAVRLLRT